MLAKPHRCERLPFLMTTSNLTEISSFTGESEKTASEIDTMVSKDLK